MSKYIYSMALFTLCYLLTACVAEELQGPVAGSGEGYLVLQLGSVSAEVQSTPLTKTGEKTTLTDLPKTSELMINIKSEKGSVYGYPKQYGELGANTTLPVGSYTIEAYHGSNSAIQSTPYFYDSKTIDITANSTKEVSLKPSLANAMLVPVVDEELQKHYTDWKLEVKVGSNPSQVLASKNNTYKLFVAEDSTVTVIFSGKNLIEKDTYKESTIIANAAKQTQYTIQCNPENLPSFMLATTATAVHTTDAENKLSGTNVKVKVKSLTGTPTELISGWKAELYNTNNTLVRTFIGTNVPVNDTECDMAADINWPYLPQGNYTLKSQLTLKTGETVAAPETTVTVKAPTFTVTASAYTSYNKYISGDIDGANACDGSTIYDMKAVPSISQNLLDNSNYSKSSSLKLDGNDVSEGNVSSQNWATHTLEVSYTFDGVSMSGNETYHVTGLPFISNPPTKTYWSKVEGDIKWEGDHVRLGYLSGSGSHTIVSGNFHRINDINVLLKTKYEVYGDARGTTFTMYIGDFVLYNTTVNDMKFDGLKRIYDRRTIESESQTSITNTNKYIKCTNSYGKGATHSKVYYVNIYYR